jgi:hypothetical protein
VLGNHDMDMTDRQGAMELFGMQANTYSFDVGGWHFVTLDLNHLNVDGRRVAYDNSNYYVEAEKRAWASTEDLAWLRADLAATDAPTLTFSHQPLGMGYRTGDAHPPQQTEVLEVLLATESAPVVASVFGHLHTDRLEWHEDIACLAINSSSYFWSKGMIPYRDPLFAIVTLDPSGTMTVEGVTSDWSDKPSDLPTTIPGVRPAISDREVSLRRYSD